MAFDASLHPVAIPDRHGRRVLAWRASITMTADFRVAALEEALARHGKPDIFNTDSHTIEASSRAV
jgi:putative transposase